MDKAADRFYLVAVLAVGLFGGHWLADRGPSKTEALVAQVTKLTQSEDQNVKAVNEFAQNVNKRLADLEQKSGGPAPSLLKK